MKLHRPASSQTGYDPPSRQGLTQPDSRAAAEPQQTLHSMIQRQALKTTAAAQHAQIQTAAQGGVIQGYFTQNARNVFRMAQEKRETNLGYTFLSGSKKGANIVTPKSGKMRIANDGEMAIASGGDKRQAKTFYASPSVLTASNTRLKNIGSPIRLASNTGINFETKVKNNTKKLSLAYPYDLRQRQAGHHVRIPQLCNEAAPHIGNTPADNQLIPHLKRGHGFQLPQWPLGAEADVHMAAILPLLLKDQNMANESLSTSIYHWFAGRPDDHRTELNELSTMRRSDLGDYLAEKGGGDRSDPNPETLRKGTGEVAKRYVKDFLQHPGAKGILKRIGLNEHVKTKVGTVLSIRTLGHRVLKPDGSWTVLDHRNGETHNNPFQYHFATIVAKSGSDYITMENYARQEEEGNRDHPIREKDPRYFFKMHGPEEQSFHSENKKDYPNAMTMAFSPDRATKDHGRELDSPESQHDISAYNKHLNSLK